MVGQEMGRKIYNYGIATVELHSPRPNPTNLRRKQRKRRLSHRPVTIERHCLAKKFPKFILGLFAERFRVTSLWKKRYTYFVSGSFFGHGTQQVN